MCLESGLLPGSMPRMARSKSRATGRLGLRFSLRNISAARETRELPFSLWWKERKKKRKKRRRKKRAKKEEEKGREQTNYQKETHPSPKPCLAPPACLAQTPCHNPSQPNTAAKPASRMRHAADLYPPSNKKVKKRGSETRSSRPHRQDRERNTKTKTEMLPEENPYPNRHVEAWGNFRVEDDRPG